MCSENFWTQTTRIQGELFLLNKQTQLYSGPVTQQWHWMEETKQVPERENDFFYPIVHTQQSYGFVNQQVPKRRSVRPSVRRPPFSKIFSSETAWPIKAKFYMKHLWEWGTNVYINNPGHMTKMVAMPIYGKNPSKIFFSGTTGPISTKLGMKH